MEKTYSILDDVTDHATGILKSFPETMTYHNYNHTKLVVRASEKIGQTSQLSSEQLEIVIIAAWFHDTGFRDTYDNHEVASKEIASEFLQSKNYPEEKIEKVLQCIDATKPPQNPQTIEEKVLCDADFIHLTKDNYFNRLMGLRLEWQHYREMKKSDQEWFEENFQFLSNHQFYTDYGKTVLAAKLQETVKAQHKMLKKYNRLQNQALETDLHLDPERLKELKKKLKKVEKSPDRGIETMFRLTSRNHIRLSAMADSKANILISVNAIIISVLLSGLIKNLDEFPYLTLPTYLLLSINVITMVFAILSTRPNVSTGRFTRQDIEEKKTNLLFFGNFHNMKKEDYKWGMLEMIKDSDYLYSSLIDDIYFLGKVLGKKYYFLRIAYNIFMFGIILAVIAYVISNFYYLNQNNI